MYIVQCTIVHQEKCLEWRRTSQRTFQFYVEHKVLSLMPNPNLWALCWIQTFEFHVQPLVFKFYVKPQLLSLTMDPEIPQGRLPVPLDLSFDTSLFEFCRREEKDDHKVLVVVEGKEVLMHQLIWFKYHEVAAEEFICYNCHNDICQLRS